METLNLPFFKEDASFQWKAPPVNHRVSVRRAISADSVDRENLSRAGFCLQFGERPYGELDFIRHLPRRLQLVSPSDVPGLHRCPRGFRKKSGKRGQEDTADPHTVSCDTRNLLIQKNYSVYLKFNQVS